MLELQDVTFGYGLRKPVIRNLSLSVPPGGRLCLMAPSGGGKSTVLRLLMGLERPRRGSVFVPEGLRVSAVFQEDRLIPGKTLLENVEMFGGADGAEEILCQLGLEEALRELPAAISGGMRRRAALARALHHPFDLLVLDEAFSGLDAAAKDRCLTLVRQEAEGKYLLMATHDLAEAEALDARILQI